MGRSCIAAAAPHVPHLTLQYLPFSHLPGPLKVMMMIGIRPVPDALGRVNKLEVMSLEELGRPRIDVVVNCSGVFRDLFVNQVGPRAWRAGVGRCWHTRATGPTLGPPAQLPPPHSLPPSVRRCCCSTARSRWRLSWTSPMR